MRGSLAAFPANDLYPPGARPEVLKVFSASSSRSARHRQMIRRSETNQSGILELLFQISFEDECIKPDSVDLETRNEKREMQLITRMVENIALTVQCKVMTVHTVYRSVEEPAVH